MARGSLLFKGGALRQLKRGTSRSGGRNNLGRITAFHRGGGAKRSLRIVDMARRAPGLVGTVERLEYDPSRTASIALVRWENDEDIAAGGGPPLHFPRSPPAARGTAGKTFPKSIGDIPRGELRSAVATICGMPMPGAASGRKVVRVDGGWRSRSFSSRGIGAFLCLEQEKVSLPGCNERSGNTYSEDNIILLRRFSDILRPIKTE